MILVFILLGIFIFLSLILSMLIFSTIRTETKDLYASNIPVKTKLSYNITISLYLFNKIKWLWISFNEEKANKIISKIPKIDIIKLEKDFQKNNFKEVKKLKIKISYLNLKVNLGLKSPITTAFLISTISSVISIILLHLAKSLETKKYNYQIMPIYQNKNLYKINLNCIIEVKMVHIINVIYMFIKKGKSDENERTASYRKSYGYSYE